MIQGLRLYIRLKILFAYRMFSRIKTMVFFKGVNFKKCAFCELHSLPPLLPVAFPYMQRTTRTGQRQMNKSAFLRSGIIQRRDNGFFHGKSLLDCIA